MCDACVKKANLEDEARVQAEALLAADKLQRERVIRAHIPFDFQHTTFKNSNPKIHPAAFLACKKYAEEFNRSSPSLIIYSDIFGSGKTHLSACIANYLLHERKIDVRFIKARDMLLQLKSTFDSGAREDEDAMLKRILDATVLVVDDLGVNSPTEWSAETWWTIFDRRLETGLQVIITTNYAPDEDGHLSARIGGGALSRLRGMCGDNIVAFKGKDLRQSRK